MEPFSPSGTITDVFLCDGKEASDMVDENRFRVTGGRTGAAVPNRTGGMPS